MNLGDCLWMRNFCRNILKKRVIELHLLGNFKLIIIRSAHNKQLLHDLYSKWHLGFHEKRYTPTLRGFDSHFGYLGPYIGYYDHSLIMLDRNYSRGYDMRRNLQMTTETKGKYATDLFTDEAVNLIHDHDVTKPLFLLLNHLAPHTGNEDKPMEAPAEVIKKFEYIKDEKRRILAAMIHVMDEGIGKVVKAIKDKGIMDNTIIMFLSDNGGKTEDTFFTSNLQLIFFRLGPTQGIHSTMASNHPLRGQKGGIFEGGCRVPACVYSPLIKNNRRISEEFMHITDILPTMASAAGIHVNTRNLDGIDQWQVISESLPSIRKEVLYNIENVLSFSSVMNDGWKLVNGSENLKNSVWLGDFKTESNISIAEYVDKVQESDAAKSLPQLTSQDIKNSQINSTVKCNSKKINKCNPIEAPCLFNIIEDPCERNNLARERPDKVKFLLSRLSYHITEIKPSLRQPVDPKCDPRFYNFQWTWWIDENIKIEEENFENFFIFCLCFLICAILILLPFVKYSKKRSIKK